MKDILGREMSLMKVVTETIKFLKQEMFNDIETRLDKLEPTDVLYVLTVPAIWTDSAKGFMRDAAEAVGNINLAIPRHRSPVKQNLH